jgi:CRP/FNR family transcriptional regulator
MKTGRANPKDAGASLGGCAEHGVAGCATCHGRGHAEWGVLSDADLEHLNAHRVSSHYRAGATIFKQGQSCEGIYCVDSGEVALRKTDEHGASAIVRLAHAGQTIGYRAFFAGGQYAASAEALMESEVCFIPSGVVRSLLEQDPRLGYRFLKRQADDLRESEERRLHATSLSTRARLAHFLLTLKDRVGQMDDDGILTVELPLSRKDLAALLGARRESIARAIRALEDAKVASFVGRTVRIPDLDTLLDELDAPGYSF